MDHATDVVPLSERRSSLTMGLLWITMVTGFPTVLAGFEWYKAGLTLPQILSCEAISCLMLLLYAIPAVLLGAVSGQTCSLLSRGVFGRWGSWLVSFNLVWIPIAWYGLTAFFLADGLKGLFHWQVPTMVLASGLAVLMSVNNFFGFTGVANFARFLAAPVLIAWVGFTFFKASFDCPAAALVQAPVESFPHALTLVSSFVIGYAAWGNEADFWRFGKPKPWHSVIPLVVALAIGQVIFPTTGWMMARITGVTSFAAATELMNQYAFGGVPIVAAIVLFVSYVAVNDSGLYGIINAIENVREMPRKQVVAILALLGAMAAAVLSQNPHAFENVASLSCVILPCATVIMIVELFVMSRIFGVKLDFSRVPDIDDLPEVRVPAVVALAAGCLVGVTTSGVIPGTEALHVGVSSLQAWLTSIVVYVPLRWLEYSRYVVKRRQILERMLITSKTARAPVFYLHPGELD